MQQNSKKFLVYMHRLKLDGRVYIGQTCMSLKQRSGSNGCRYKNCTKFYNAIQKYGWNNFEHIVLYQNLTLDEANRKEKELIEKYNSINNGFNLVAGGRNHTWSEEDKKKMRQRNLGNKNPNWGKPRSEETKRKIGQANRISQLGKFHTEETKQKMSQSNKKYQPIICVETGKKYDYMIDAALDVSNKKQSGHIKEVCEGKRKTAFGYHWKYFEKDNEEIL